MFCSPNCLRIEWLAYEYTPLTMSAYILSRQTYRFRCVHFRFNSAVVPSATCVNDFFFLTVPEIFDFFSDNECYEYQLSMNSLWPLFIWYNIVSLMCSRQRQKRQGYNPFFFFFKVSEVPLL